MLYLYGTFKLGNAAEVFLVGSNLRRRDLEERNCVWHKKSLNPCIHKAEWERTWIHSFLLQELWAKS